jgi:penicillin-binding protein 1A
MGVTKELVTGVWTGNDEPRIRFRNSANGEGSKTALPIYCAYMDLVYKTPELGISKGRWPAPSIEITKPYNCRTPWQRAAPDSLNLDSIIQQDVDPIEMPEDQNNQPIEQ